MHSNVTSSSSLVTSLSHATAVSVRDYGTRATHLPHRLLHLVPSFVFVVLPFLPTSSCSGIEANVVISPLIWSSSPRDQSISHQSAFQLIRAIKAPAVPAMCCARASGWISTVQPATCTLEAELCVFFLLCFRSVPQSTAASLQSILAI